ncbi:enolase C-terminal domain-like protein [Glycomyces salinus]|uniref:enolase C-terminal domain-like protein n=1 Tax=Glycomyces salinus TaxID=980294 RepID=UPI0018EBEC44|nr:enolase C-terminal domain-like protein [Glycomyces salinus]
MSRVRTGPIVRQAVVTPVAVPDPPLLNAVGVHEPWALRAVIELRCEDGLIGLGETYGDAPHLALLRRAAATLPGLDVFDGADLQRRLAAAVGTANAPDRHGLTGATTPAKTLAKVTAPFEIACLDAQGHATGRSVADLLGGRHRDRIPFAAYLFYKWAAHPGGEDDEWGPALEPSELVDQARRMTERHGFASLKLKGGVRPPEEELEAVTELRRAFPDHPIRFDPNAAWTTATALRFADGAEGLLEYLEDPTPGLAGMAAVAEAAPMPLATNMCAVGFDDLPAAIDADAVGIVLCDPHYWGGLRATLQLAGICRTWGLGLSMHSNTHLGISLAAMVHTAAALPDLAYALDTHTPWQGGADVVLRSPRIEGGSVAVPDSPGLGVELDRDALERMHRDYLRCGLTERDDTSYMRRIDPDFEGTLPRW